MITVTYYENSKEKKIMLDLNNSVATPISISKKRSSADRISSELERRLWESNNTSETQKETKLTELTISIGHTSIRETDRCVLGAEQAGKISHRSRRKPSPKP